jgi:hypothetical protein
MPKAGMACALCRYAIDLVAPLVAIETDAEYMSRQEEIQSRLNRALAATYKASSLYNLPAFTHHLASFNDMAGRTAEAQRLNALYAKKQTRSNATIHALRLKMHRSRVSCRTADARDFKRDNRSRSAKQRSGRRCGILPHDGPKKHGLPRQKYYDETLHYS